MLTVGSLRLRCGHGKIATIRRDAVDLRDGFPDDAASMLTSAAYDVENGHGLLIRSIRDAAPDVIPAIVDPAELARLRADLATAEREGRRGDERRLRDDLDEAEHYTRRVEGLHRLLADLDGADAIADTDRAPDTERISLRP